MRAYQTITNNPCTHIIAELLLVSGMDYTMKILLYPLVLVVNIDNVVSTETCTTCKEHSSVLFTDEAEMLSTLLNKTPTEILSRWRICQHEILHS
jgi:hypothetical protein